MLIIGCDFHSRFQHIAMLDTQTGEIVERRLEHETGDAEQFYRSLPHTVRVGMESSGHAHWFERLLAELGHELWVGDAARIRAGVVRKQKTDARDASHIPDLLLTDRFPRVWRPSPVERDVRQLLVHRQKTGADSDQGEEPVAVAGNEPGHLHTTEAVGPRWPPCTGRPGPRTVDQPASGGVAANVGSAQSLGRGVGSSR